MINLRLDDTMIGDLLELSKQEDFPYELSIDEAKKYCSSENIKEQTTQTYGAYYRGTILVSVMTASYVRVFPHKDSPSGKIVHISGAYTHPNYRCMGYATTLVKAIEKDAKEFGADYICLDSTADKFWTKNEFIKSNESRLWKPFN